MDRNAAYKMRSIKFSDASKARAQRIADQSNSRKNARENLRNAKRGLTVDDQSMCIENTFNLQPEKKQARELTHQEKLQDRLARLEKWREHKKATEQKAKARKKAPFIVPGVCKTNNKCHEEDLNISCVSKASTKSTALVKKSIIDKQWNVTSHEIQTKKKAAVQPLTKPLTKPFKPELITFAPKNFNFSGPGDKNLASHGVSQHPKAKIQLSLDQKKCTVLDTVKSSPVTSKAVQFSLTLEKVAEETPKRSAKKMITPKRTPKPKTAAKVNDGSQFRSTMETEADRLNQLCSDWESILYSEDVPEEEHGSVRTVIGQAQLLQRERFKQFGSLIDQYETNTGEKEITPMDLQGFWELVYIQVEDVINKFEKLEVLKNNGWQRHDSPMKKAKVGLKKKTAARPAAGKSNFRAFLANVRKNQELVKSPKTPSRRSSLHFSSPFRTPGSGKSLRKTAMINSAKKPVFLVTDMESYDKENSPLDAGSPIGVPRTPERGSFRKRDTVDQVTTPNDMINFRLPVPEFEFESSNSTPGKKSRKSVSGKKTPKRTSGRPSLLPVFQVSPVTPQDDLISFD